MQYEYERCYSQALGGNGVIDKENCFEKDITEQEAKSYMGLLETVYGLKRHETSTHYFYSRQLNCHETEEYRFWK